MRNGKGARHWLSAQGQGFGRGLRAVSILALVAGSAVPFSHVAQAQSYTFSAVEIEGNVRVDGATILAFAKLPRGTEITAAALNDAYQRILASGLFEKVELDPRGGTLVIRVTELPMIDVMEFEGNKRLKDDILLEVVKSRGRLIYNPAQAEADAAAIAEVYRERGRMAASVTPKIIRQSDNRVSLVFEITEGGVAEIQRLNFIGNRDFSDYRLRQVLRTKQAGILHNLIQRDTFDADRLELDQELLRNFYLSRGYIDFRILDATAEYARDRDATFLTFTIEEGRSFKLGTVSTVSEIEGLDTAVFDRLRMPRPGATYSPNLIDGAAQAMEALAAKQGLNFVRVDPRITRNDAEGTLDVAFTLVKGERVFVERIDIEGNTTTLDQVLRRQFRPVEGDPLNPAEIRQAAERIRALGFFDVVNVQSRPGGSADRAVVKVEVTEVPTGSLSFGATYGTANGFGLNFGFSETNFLGRGQGLTLNVQSGSDNVDSVLDFTEPAFLGRDVTFNLNAAYGTSEHNNANYDTESLSFSPSLSFPLSDLARLKIDYSLSQDEMSNVDRSVADDPMTVEDESRPGSSDILIREEGSRLTSSLGYGLTYDTRGSGMNPNGGMLLRFGQDFAGLGGDATYIATNFLALAETKAFHEQVDLRAVLEGGVISGLNGYTTTAMERYFGNKIRGFDPNGLGPRDLGAENEDALGGNYFIAAHFEADFPLGLPEEYGITGGAFIDIGSVWGLHDTAGTGGTVDDSLRLRAVAGLSVFWTTPIGPLRLNFTRALQKESYDQEQTFDLTIATKF